MEISTERIYTCTIDEITGMFKIYMELFVMLLYITQKTKQTSKLVLTACNTR